METKTNTEDTMSGKWITTVTALCAIHGVKEIWGAYGDTPLEAHNKLNDTRDPLEEAGHELDSWHPIFGRVFELPLPKRPSFDDSPPTRTPTEIARVLAAGRPDLSISYINTGGNVMCIVADRQLTAVPLDISDTAVFFGVASGHLGWTNAIGSRFDDWPGFDVHDAWVRDIPIYGETAQTILARISSVLTAELPRVEDDDETDPEHNLFEDDKAEAVNSAARANLDMDLRRVNAELYNTARAMANDLTRLLEDLELLENETEGYG